MIKNNKGIAVIAVIIPIILVAVIGVILVASGVINFNIKQVIPTSLKSYGDKKVLYIDSYHEGYDWSDGITRGIEDVVGDTDIEFKIHRMDTKRNPSEEFKKEAAKSAKKVVEDFDPDVLIVSDDNAFKYLVMAYYKDDDLPIVFSGLNWDASLYGAPYSNTTGMVEVSLTVELIELLKEYGEGGKVGYLSADTITERKNEEYYKKLFDLEFDQVYFVATFADWKSAYKSLQNQVDVILFENNAGIADWSDKRAENFAIANVEVPVGTTNPWTMQSSLLGLTKVPEEQGEWSAKTVLRILDGENVSEIPLVNNKKGELHLNLKMAEELEVIFKSSEIKNAVVYE